ELARARGRVREQARVRSFARRNGVRFVSGMTTNTAKPTRIWIVAHDFSDCADDAADMALDDLLDSKTGGSIVLVHAFDLLLPPGAIDPMPSSDYTMTSEAETRTAATH